MDDSADYLCFEFGDPDFSDVEDTSDKDDEDSDPPSVEEFGGDEEFQLPDRLDTSVCATDKGKSIAREPNFLGEPSNSNYRARVPYVQASELNRCLQAGMSVIEKVERVLAGTSSGPSNAAADPVALINLYDDLDHVLSKFVGLREAAAAATEEEFPGLQDADTAESDYNLAAQKGEASCSYSEYPDGRSKLLPLRKRLIVKFSGRDSPDLDFKEKRAESHVHYSEAGPSIETLQENLALIGPALMSLTRRTKDIASSSSEGLQIGTIESGKVGVSEGTVPAEARMKREFGGLEDPETKAILRPETPDGKERSGNEEGEEEGISSDALTQPSAAVAGPSSDGESIKIQVVLSPRQRLTARLSNSRINDGSYVCSKCGVQQYIQANDDICKICSDVSRSFSLLDPVWMSHMEVESLSMENVFHLLEPDLSYQIYTISISGGFQSQRAILLKLPEGNILWDCLTYIDEETVVGIAKMGGLKAIAVSNPDRMGACVRMSYIFNRCPIYIHMRDRDYLERLTGKNAREPWHTQMKYLGDGVTLIHLGGHYPGSSILHLDHKGGIVFSSHTLKIGTDRNSVSVMLDYSNHIPASAKDVKRILRIMEGLEFDQVWGDQLGEEILEQAKPRVISSLQRYLRWIQHDEDGLEFQTRPLTKRELIARGKRKVDEI